MTPPGYPGFVWKCLTRLLNIGLQDGAVRVIPCPAKPVFQSTLALIKPERRCYLIKTRRNEGSFRLAWLTTIKPPDYKGFWPKHLQFSLRTC
jgi:hypothetical protein